MSVYLLSTLVLTSLALMSGTVSAKARYPGLVGSGNPHGFTGEFFCEAYRNSPHLNKWHYVDIIHAGGDKFKWTNKAGVSWTLTYMDSNTLAVGTDCPYYKKPFNHREVKYTDDYVEGPSGEKYFRTKYSKRFTGHFVNNQYNPQNNWHFVEISYTGNGNYKWTNRAGVSWTLRSKDSNVLAVQSDCPYYRHGHTEAKFTDDRVFGPWNEIYNRQTNPYTGRFFAKAYENSPHLNNWHYVDITYVGGNLYRWTNKAGRSWTLTSNGSNNSPAELDVGRDCPYYNFGNHRKLEYKNGYSYVLGPWGEQYHRQNK